MTSSLIGARYARALAELILKPGSGIEPDRAVEQLKNVEAIIAGSGDLKGVLMTPAIQISRKKAVVSSLAEMAGVAPLLRNFLGVVVSHKRVAQLSQIRASLESILDEEMGVARAGVTSAVPLNASQKKMVEVELERLSGKRVRMETAVDPALLGGVVARIGSTVYDGSLRGQLASLRRMFTGEAADFKVGT